MSWSLLAHLDVCEGNRALEDETEVMFAFITLV